MDRRSFITALSASALFGCASTTPKKSKPPVVASKGKARFHVFSKMFQSPVTKSPEELCDLFAGAGYQGVQWTVRPGGHATAENVKTELPRLVKIAEERGLKVESICTAIVARDSSAETIVKTAGDCGIRLFRPGYYFYNQKKGESLSSSLDRIRRGFDDLYALARSSGMRFAYQNHSTWGSPTKHGEVFGAPIWDLHSVLKDLDPQYAGVEFDPMHALFENFHSWSQAMELVAPYIAAVDLKDFRYKMDEKHPGWMYKEMVAAGEGVVPWGDVAALQRRFGVDVPYVVHFEYDFDKTDLRRTVSRELAGFAAALGAS